jgi:hypothetical protein
MVDQTLSDSAAFASLPISEYEVPDDRDTDSKDYSSDKRTAVKLSLALRFGGTDGDKECK